ncbi:MAG: MarR family transcriptional regulator [Armatimonadetes bacterium]|nr:MarR family transcriptional regulator [Armatimonadota bacterium]
MGTHYRGPPEEVRALDVYIKLVRAAESLVAKVSRHVETFGLTVSQFGVLEALHHLGALCQNALGRKLLRTGGNITLVVDNLEKAGLVARERQKTDRRFITVNLTPRGRDLIAEVFPGVVEIIVKEMAPLSPAEQERLGLLCRKLGLGTNDKEVRNVS